MATIKTLGDFVNTLTSVMEQGESMAQPGMNGASESLTERIVSWIGWKSSTFKANKAPSKLGYLSPTMAQGLADGLTNWLQSRGQEFQAPQIVWGKAKDRNKLSEDEIRPRLEWLEGLVRAVETALAKPVRPPEPPRLPHPQWRRVARPKLLARVETKLEEAYCVAIVGMSGTGKSFLADAVLSAFQGRTRRFEAPKPLDGKLTKVGFLPLMRDAFEYICELPGLNWARRELPLVDKGIVDELARLNSQLSLSDERLIKTTNIHTAAELASEIREKTAFSLQSEVMLSALKIACRLAERKRRTIPPTALLYVDDIWHDPDGRAAEIVQVLGGLRLSAETELPWRLLLTSQQRNAGIAWKLAAAEDAAGQREHLRHTVELDRDDEDNENFGLEVAAAWAARSHDALTREEASLLIQESLKNLAQDAAFADIRWVVRRLRSHPLTVATIAAAWRRSEFSLVRPVWHGAREALLRDGEIRLELGDIDSLSVTPGVYNSRHVDRVKALLFALDLLHPADRQRYYDLTLHRPGSGPLHVGIFQYLWDRADRGDGSRFIVDDRHALIRLVFADAMLVQTEQQMGGPAAYVLHDMHRQAILVRLRDDEKSLEARHWELLQYLGIVDTRPQVFALDEAKDFDMQVDPDAAGLANSGRTLLHLRLRKAPNADRMPGSEERREISAYAIRELAHHLRSSPDGEKRRAVELAARTCFPLLQALLDRRD